MSSLLLAIALAGPPSLGPGTAHRPAVGSIPAEEGAVLVPNVPTLQALAADVDGDGRRELVRLIRDEESATLVDVWRLGDAGWGQAADPVEVLPPAQRGAREDRVYAEASLRMLAWHDGIRERVLVASQPRFEILDTGPACCLLLDELSLGPDGLGLSPIAQPSFAVHGLLALDIDGNGVDELLTTQRLLGGAGVTPLEARIYRWMGEQFGAPATRDLLYGGDGNGPFLLGETDGVVGEEAGLIAGQFSELHRISLDESGVVSVDSSGLSSIRDAVAIGGDAEPGLVTLTSDEVVHVVWPKGGEAQRAAAVPAGPEDRLAGVVGGVDGGSPRVVVAATGTQSAVRVLDAVTLERVDLVPASDVIGGIVALPLRPYVGPLTPSEPGSDLLALGLRLRAGVSTARPMATLLNATPLGQVGDGRWTAVAHATVPVPVASPQGGVFAPLTPIPGAWYAIVRNAVLHRPEADGGLLELQTSGAVSVGSGPRLYVGPDGFQASLAAPAGSHVAVFGADAVGGTARNVVPDGGRLVVGIRPTPPSDDAAGGLVRSQLVVLTPAGHAYLAAWEVQPLIQPPPLRAAAATRLGSFAVEVTGSTLPVVEVRVGGRRVPVGADGRFVAAVGAPPWPTTIEITAVDPAGNRSSAQLVAVGLIDYRGVPLLPLGATLIGIAGAFLLVKVPRLRPPPRAAGDDSRIEELEGD